MSPSDKWQQQEDFYMYSYGKLNITENIEI